ncbi:MAG: carboxypeptidase-like regulatory domain-containing protein [Flammeovirgaceae bacterium]
MSRLTLSVPKPCHEDWDKFTPTERGAFCANCGKEVIDFTRWTDAEIQAYFLNVTGSTCGRLKQTQLKAYSQIEKRWYSRWITLFAFLTLIMTRNTHAQVKGKTQLTEQQDQRQHKTVNHLRDNEWMVMGKVVDENLEPLPGVNIIQQKSTNGTVTDVDGTFSLTIDQPRASEVISASFIGLKTTDTLVFKSTSDLLIKMKVDIAALNEVVIMGGVCGTRSIFRRTWWKLKSIFQR